MTIDEAIKLLQKEARHYLYLPDHKKMEATRLGIEALKQLGDWRKGGVLGLDEPLPGETKDEVKSNYPYHDEKADEVYKP
ncbi:unnamed protein product [marine sediment metagenome]|uniref:Uncharacterized protein n=1 Tax=marine sediment metagenome TaxID=412755 RepID=X1SQH0_9ZZZZ